MLNREQAQERLKEFAADGGTKRWQEGVNRLPGHLRRIGQPMVDRVTRRAVYPANAESYKMFFSAMQDLASLQPRERLEIFTAFFPKLAPYVEQAWQLCASLPYHPSKAYRAPQLAAAPHVTRSAFLETLLYTTQSYDQDIQWYAAWAPYIGWGTQNAALGVVFAAAINAGDPAGNQVFETLVASARGEHEIGSFGHHVTRGLLIAARPDGWEFIEKMLLAAQRQEGLRQAILETIDLAHPGAFRRMLRVIIDNDLVRFSATIRSVDVWLGFGWDAEKSQLVNQTLAQLLDLLEHPDASARALASDDAQTNYLALWALAFQDAESAIPHAENLLHDSRVEQRFVGTHLLSELQLTSVYPQLLPMLHDEDMRIAARVLQALLGAGYPAFESANVFDQVAGAVRRFPHPNKELAPIVWDWIKLPASRSAAASLLVRSLGKRSPKELLPYLDAMDTHDRAQVAVKLAELTPRDRQVQEALLDLVGDSSHFVRERALQALSQQPVSPVEAQRLEAMLTREASDLRRGVIDMLLKQGDIDARATAERLLASANAQQRLAGLELFGQMLQAGRHVQVCRTCVNEYRASRAAIADAEQRLIDFMFQDQPVTASLDDALGLMNPNERTKPTPPRPQRELGQVAGMSSLVTPTALALAKSLDEFIDANRTTPLAQTNVAGTQEQLLGNLRWGLGLPNPAQMQNTNAPTFPLRELWETWWRDCPESQRDDDGLELLRVWAIGGRGWHPWNPAAPKQDEGWKKPILELLFGRADQVALKYPAIVHSVAAWLAYLYPPKGAADLLLDAVELTFSLIPVDELKRRPEGNAYYDTTWRGDHRLLTWLNLVRWFRAMCPSEWTDEHHIRLWRLLRWFDEPVFHDKVLGVFQRAEETSAHVPRLRPPLEEMIAAYRAGAATQDDVLDHLLGPRDISKWSNHFPSLRMLSGRKSHAVFADVPILRDLVNRCRDRIIDIETRRGELPTAASAPSLAVRSASGGDKLARLLRALGKGNLVRGYTFDSLSKSSVLSHLIRVTFPGDTDTFESFGHTMRDAHVSQGRSLEVAVYAPQWAEFIEHALGWEGLADAVWWFHAHTKDSYWHVDQEIREIWQAESTERTPLTGQDLIEGAVDVDWFRRVWQSLGQDRWNALYKAAKAGSGGKGHTRARLVADAMLGRVDKTSLTASIRSKRHQDSVRALGLVPLGDDRERDVLERYEVIQEFLRTSKKFGAMRQQSEKRAAKIALDNLARTAGYADPIRLEWAMEARAIADFAEGSKTITRGDVSLTLAIDKWGEANLTVTKNDKPLKTIPAKLKQDAEVVELKNRKKEIERQASRMRASLEQAMCRGDAYGGAELASFFDHPLLKPMIERLIFTSEDATGYPTERGRALRSHDGSLVPVRAEVEYRVAHPHDLLNGREWHLWQRECFDAERIQPFKQIFRELYVLTAAEMTDQAVSHRYAGHQVQTRQALALLGQRGWVNHPEEGVRRVFHEERLAAWVALDQGWTTPAEVEGARVEDVYFARRGEWKPLPLQDVPPRIFSEAMRDLDLVVSVAHAGGVDPEASASTVEMRASLVNQTCAWLKLENVRVQSQHVLIDGKLGNYSVHLGSAVVHRQPGGMVCIVPVPSQHRGRLFLPFADDDPRTAEVLAKVLLLARDTEIRDPVILQQLQA